MDIIVQSAPRIRCSSNAAWMCVDCHSMQSTSCVVWCRMHQLVVASTPAGVGSTTTRHHTQTHTINIYIYIHAHITTTATYSTLQPLVLRLQCHTEFAVMALVAVQHGASDANTTDDYEAQSRQSHALLRHALSQGLQSMLVHAGDNPATLLGVATHSLHVEESVATGCLMIQSVALVRLWTVLFQQQLHKSNEKHVAEWGKCEECEKEEGWTQRLPHRLTFMTFGAAMCCALCISISMVSSQRLGCA